MRTALRTRRTLLFSPNASPQQLNINMQEQDLLITFNQQDVITSAYKINTITPTFVTIENVHVQENPDTYNIPIQFMNVVINAGIFQIYRLANV